MSSTPLQQPPARDAVGAATLERLAIANRFNRWMYERISPWIGASVLEIGSGIGNLSQFFADRDRVVLTDTEPAYRTYLENRFPDRSRVSVVPLTLPDVPAELAANPVQSVVCLNVLEHIEDDRAALAAMRRLLTPGGHLALLVPALPWLYGTLDRALGHYRRYTRPLLRERFAEAGLGLRRLSYFNLAGITGWWLMGKVLRREVLPAASLAAYEALVPLFRLERLIPARVGLSLIAIGERAP